MKNNYNNYNDYSDFKNQLAILLNGVDTYSILDELVEELKGKQIIKEDLLAEVVSVEVDGANGDTEDDLIVGVRFTNRRTNKSVEGYFYFTREDGALIPSEDLDDENYHIYHHWVNELV